MHLLEELLARINSLFWNGPMLFLLLFSHLYFTVRLRFVQKKLPAALRLSVGHSPKSGAGTAKPSPDAASPKGGSFVALATTLAATLGTGNIIGVSAAIAVGGPGALFWCFLTGVFGMATTYAECYLGSLFRKKMPDGSLQGGPMYALEHGLHKKKLACFYAAATVFAAYGIGCSTQSRAFVDAAVSFGLPRIPTGILLAVFVGLVIVGGAGRIRQLCTRLVPVMGGIYIFCCILILVHNLPYLPSAVALMLKSAFSPHAVTSGILSGSLMSALRYGVTRGLFTNEAGLGSAALAAADADHPDPSTQALVSMTATFWDTIVMCSMTGLAILTTALAAPDTLRTYSINDLTQAAFVHLSPRGGDLLNLCLMAFAFATLIGWSYFGEKATLYLTGTRGIFLYKTTYLLMIFLGSILSLTLIWELTDFANLCMALPNLFALFALRKAIKTPD